MATKRRDKLHVWQEHPKGSGPKGKWYWNLTSAYNGKIKCSGQAAGYSSKAKAEEGYASCGESFINGVDLVVNGRDTSE